MAYLMNEVKLRQASKAIMQAVHAFQRNTQVIRKQAEEYAIWNARNHILRSNSEQIIKFIVK